MEQWPGCKSNMRDHDDAATVDVDRQDTREHNDPRNERERPCYPKTGAAAVGVGSSSHSRDGDDDVIPAVASPGTTQHQQCLTAVVRDEQGRSSSAPPPAGAGGVPSFMSGTPPWSFAQQLMSSLFGDQQQQQQQQQQQAHQQRRVGEGGNAVIVSAGTDVATPTTSSSSSTMATGTTSTIDITPTLDISQPLLHPISSVVPSSSPTPSASLTTPILHHSSSSDGGRFRERSDDICGTNDDTNIKDYSRGIGNNNCDSNNSKATNVITLTRTHFSSPESRQTNYHPLQDDDEYVYYEHHHHHHQQQQEQQHDDIHHGSMGHIATFTAKDETATPVGKSGGEDSIPLGNSDLFLRHAYPLTLQRSASSAFGCPHTSTSSSSSFCNFKTRARVRTLSNSGYSDPGASAFRPVWNKSSSSSTDVGSDVGSTISSSISGAVAATTHSDPLSDRTQTRAFYSPWRRVMNRMKKGSYNSSTNNSSCDKGNLGGGRKLTRRLSGRENPNAAGLDGGDDDSDGAGLVGVISSLSELHVEESLPTSSAGSDFEKATSAKEGNSAEFFASFKSPSVQPYHHDDQVCDVEVVDSKGKSFASLAACHPEVQYDDPGVALDLSDDSDNDDEEDVPQFLGLANHTNEKIAAVSFTCTNLKRNTKEEPSPPVFDQIPCDSVEVTTMLVSESILGSVRIIASDSIDENSPPTVERVIVCENADNFPYHPLSDSDGEDNYETEQGDEFNVEDLQGDANFQSAGRRQLARLKYRSPQRAPRPIQPTLSSRGNSGFIIGQQLSPSSSQDSPDSRYSSLGGSPESRISSSNSRSVSSTLNSSGDRTCITEGSLVADNEVRNANRRQISGRPGGAGSGGEIIGNDNNQEVVVGPDGSETVVSSSTASSSAWPYLSSPRTLRDGATMPVERFFAGGNVTMSPSPQAIGTIVHSDDITGGRDIKDHALPSSRSSSAPIISKLLIPKKLSKKSSGGTVGSVRDSTHSPHTVSSNSVSANSSSSTETKKPLKFVAYEFHEERESPFDEPPVSGYDTVRGGNEATSGVSCKNDPCLALIKPRISKLGGISNSHRPPMVQRPSASVPVKPPQSPRRTALFHGRARTPTRTPPPSSLSSNAVPRSGSSTPSSPPVIIDGPSNAGMFWIPQHRAIPPRPGTAAFPMSSQLQTDELIVNDVPSVGDDEVKDMVRNALSASGVEISAPSTTMGVVVSPEKLQETTRRLHLISPKPKLNATQSLKLCEAVIVSPEKGGE